MDRVLRDGRDRVSHLCAVIMILTFAVFLIQLVGPRRPSAVVPNHKPVETVEPPKVKGMDHLVLRGKMACTVRRELSREFKGELESAKRRLIPTLARISEPATFINIGVNEGHELAIWDELVPRSRETLAIGFEPGPFAYRLLKEGSGSRISALESGRLVIENLAVSNATGRLPLCCSCCEQLEGRRLCRQYTKCLKPDWKGDGVDGFGNPMYSEVPVTTLDLYYGIDHRLKGRRIDLLCLDCEGCEFDAMLGMRSILESGTLGVMYYEYNCWWTSYMMDVNTGKVSHPPGKKMPEPNLESTTKWLSDLGYASFWIGTSSLVPISGDMWDPDYEVCSGPSPDRWFDIMVVRRDDPILPSLIRSYFNDQSLASSVLECIPYM